MENKKYSLSNGKKSQLFSSTSLKTFYKQKFRPLVKARETSNTILVVGR